MSDADASSPAGTRRNQQLFERLIGVAEGLARQSGQQDVARGVAALGDHFRQMMPRNCRDCIDEAVGRATEALLVSPQARPRKDRRNDFLLRMVVAQFADRLTPEIANAFDQLPRAVLINFAGFLERKIGHWQYADLNASACRMLSLLADESDAALRHDAFLRPETRGIAFRVLFQVVNSVGDWPATYRLFSHHVSLDIGGKGIFQARQGHFRLVYDRLFERLLDCLRHPVHCGEVERQIGQLTAERALSLFDSYEALAIEAPPPADRAARLATALQKLRGSR